MQNIVFKPGKLLTHNWKEYLDKYVSKNTQDDMKQGNLKHNIHNQGYTH